MLPIEIQEQIIDHLHDDTLALKACSLTCSAWVPTARLHLFWLVKLTRQRDCLRFLTVLESTSTAQGGTGVGTLVRELHLLGLSLEQTGRRRGLRYDLLCQITRRLPNVETLVLHRFDWCTLMGFLCSEHDGVDLRDAIASVFRFSHLKALHLQYINPRSPVEILQFLQAFPSLSTLELNEIAEYHGDLDYRTMVRLRDGDPPIRIRVFIIKAWSCAAPFMREILRSLLRPPFELRLRRLEWKNCRRYISSREQVGTELVTIFRNAADTLEEFEISFASNEQLQMFEFWRHCLLRLLTLSFRFSPFFLNHWSSVPEFLSTFETPHLQEIELRFEDLAGDNFNWEFLDWREMLQALLSLHRRHPSMTVTFSFLFRAKMVGMPSVVEPPKALIEDALKSGIKIMVVRTGLVSSSK